MRFTPTTAAFLAYAKGIFRYMEWKCYARKTSTFTTALGTGTWTEVSDYTEGIPEFPSAIEFETGQFRIDTIQIRGRSIAWWLANVLNPGAGEEVEVKWTVQIGLGPAKLSPDLVYAFAGWVRMNTVKPNDADDSVTFDVASQESLAQDMPGELLSTQYIEDDVEGDGTGTNGLILDQIPGIYATDANVSSYVLKAGVHIVHYSYNSGSRVASLDDGSNASLSNGATTLVNSAGDQKLTIYIRDITKLPSSDDLSQDVIVTTPTDTLPRQWFRRVSARAALTSIYTQMGITTTVFDALQMNTHDGAAAVSFLDQPPGDFAVSGYRWAMVTDGTDLFIGVGHKVYKRTMATDAYALVATLTAGDRITKLMYNARNNDLWIYYGGNVDGEGKIRRYDIGGASLSAEVAIANSHKANVLVFDAEYTAASWEYCVLYADASAKSICRVDGSSLAVTTLFSQATLGYTGSDGPDLGLGYLRASIRYGFSASDATYGYYHEIYVDAFGAWVDDGQVNIDVPDPSHTIAAYDPDEDKIYYWDPVTSKVKVCDRTGTSGTDVLTLASGDLIYNMHFANSKTYLTTDPDGAIYSLESGASTLLSSSPGVTTKWNTLSYANSRLYGIDSSGRLFQLHTALAFYVDIGDFEGKSVQQALTDTLNAFLLIATISSTKAGRIYRRGNDDGDAQTSGNTLTLTTDEISSFSKETNVVQAIEWVEVTNGVTTHSYDGTTFDADLTITGRRLRISNALIPNEIVKSLAYWLYQFFSTTRHLYTIELACVPLFQYEVFDAVSASLTTERLAETISGLIVGQTLRSDGSMQLTVMAPL